MDKVRSVFGAADEAGKQDEEMAGEFEEIVRQCWREARLMPNFCYYSPTVTDTAIWQDVKKWPDEKKVRFILWATAACHQFTSQRRDYSGNDSPMEVDAIRVSCVRAFFRSKICLDENDLEAVYDAFLTCKFRGHISFLSWPVGLMINQLEKQWSGRPVGDKMRAVLQVIRNDIDRQNHYSDAKETARIIARIDGLLFNSTSPGDTVAPARFLGSDDFGDFANADLEAMPAESRNKWYLLLPLAQTASGGKPSAKYLKDVRKIIDEIGDDSFKETISRWFDFLIQLKEKQQTRTYNWGEGYVSDVVETEYISTINAEAVKGLVWACVHFPDSGTVRLVAALGDRAFRKIPGKGPSSIAIGNACLYTLFKTEGMEGIGHLSRLRLRIRQGSTLNLIDRYLAAAAEEKGVSISEIEDMAMDDCGLQDGRIVMELGDYKGVVSITGPVKASLSWYRLDGNEIKSVPAVVKEKDGRGLRSLKDTLKQVEQTLAAQRDRLDRMFRTGRRIARAAFQQYYLEHGIMSHPAKTLIWNFHREDGSTVAAYLLDGQWVNSGEQPVATDDARFVSLWHPVTDTIDNIRAWREFMVRHQLQQPLKQAYREVYLLTDAERRTQTYSNRMASHIIRQHQFNSLAKARDWRYSLMGNFDNGGDNGVAHLLLPADGLRAEFWVNEVNARDEMNDTGIWNYVSTDQVRFVSTVTSEVVDLEDIPPLAFSEVMRDVDLFVGVASVGNDPTWRDTGGLPVYRDYWQDYAFGDLTEIAKSRKGILTDLVPRLKIRDLAEVRDKFLIVRGKLRTYKIHIGSTNILMEPNDQYLCIVPDKSPKNNTGDLFLPFEGDSGLSIILSKAFLLAEDDKITDRSITSQILNK